MAKFEIAYEITARYEGGYVNDPADAGGETIFGVARNSWKNLAMWDIVDGYKKQGLRGSSLELACKNDAKLMAEVHHVYKTQYWDKVWGDKIVEQKRANAIYDFAVNSGVSRAVRYAQLCLGVSSDGKMGPNTVKALNDAEAGFLKEYIDMRIRYFNSICKSRPANQKFLKGWTARANGLR